MESSHWLRAKVTGDRSNCFMLLHLSQWMNCSQDLADTAWFTPGSDPVVRKKEMPFSLQIV